MLKDFSQRTIPIGAKVNLEIGWKDASVTVPVYLAETYGEPFLLGTNAAMPLGLMTPDLGVKVENTEDSGPRSMEVRLVTPTRVPSTPISLYQFCLHLGQSSGLQLEDTLLQPDDTGQVYLLVHKETLLKETHSGLLAGHFSPKSVYEKLARCYWWEGMYRDVVQHCKACLTCASYRGAGCRNKPTLKPIEVGGPFERVGVDILEMPPTERKSLYCSFCGLPKWVEAFPTSDQTSDTIAHLLIFLGAPLILEGTISTAKGVFLN